MGRRIRPSPQDRPVSSAPARPIRLGLRENLAQFSLLVGVNALVGAMIGQERTVLPLLGVRVFHLHAFTAALTYIVAFGVMKALTNFVAGALSDRTGRKPVLVAGWLIGVRSRSCSLSARPGAGSSSPTCCWASTRASPGLPPSS